MVDRELSSIRHVNFKRDEGLGAVEIAKLLRRHTDQILWLTRGNSYSAAAPAGFFSSFMFELWPGKMLADGSR